MLPRIDLPTYNFDLKSSNKKIKYRPFTVGEQEILLQAKPQADENPNKEEILNATKNIVEKCTFNSFDVDSIPIFEFVLLFIKIRSVSIDDKVSFTYVDKSTEKEDRINVSFSLNDVDINYPEDHSKIIDVSDDIKIEMKYPTWGTYSETSTLSEPEFVCSCIDSICTQTDVYSASEYSKTELLEWYNSLPFITKNKIDSFFVTMPHIYYSQKVKLRSGKERVLEYKSLEDFF